MCGKHVAGVFCYFMLYNALNLPLPLFLEVGRIARPPIDRQVDCLYQIPPFEVRTIHI